ncbi:MAG: hypothetical protein IJK46_01095 [Prevotella sp.]|nr:hypothetical protein [Prevotella sp.]
MKKIIKSLLLLAAVTAGTGTFVSCSDDDDLTTADALFRPIINEDDNIEQGLDENTIPYMIVTWDNYTSANQYTVRIESIDGSDKKEVTTSETTCRFDNLNYDTEYYVYINSANTQTGLSSKPYSLTTTTLDYPTSLSSLSTSDIIDTQARVKWSGESTVYDNIKIYKDSNDSLVCDTVITDDINAAQQLIFKGLAPKTGYRVEAYNNGSYQGKKRFTTVASEKYSGAVFDLRGMDEETAKTYITTDQIAADVEANPDEDITYVVEGGVSYKISGGTAIPATTKTVKFVTGLTLAGNAKFISGGGFAIVKGADVYGLEFEKIDFVSDKFNSDDVQAGIAANTDKGFGGRQVFNINGVKSTLSNLTFKDCSMQGYRAVVRSQADNDNITNIVMEGCFINGIGDQGVLTSTNKKAEWKTVLMKNCTVTNIVLLCDFRAYTTSNKLPIVLNIENCTFCYAPMETNANTNTPMFRAGDNTTINIKNTLFGPSMATAESAGSTMNPYKAGSVGSIMATGSPTFNVEDSYKTNFDWYTVTAEDGSVTSYGIDGVANLGISETELWSSPNKGQFGIIGKVSGVNLNTLGDSRWQ